MRHIFKIDERIQVTQYLLFAIYWLLLSNFIASDLKWLCYAQSVICAALIAMISFASNRDKLAILNENQRKNIFKRNLLRDYAVLCWTGLISPAILWYINKAPGQTGLFGWEMLIYLPFIYVGPTTLRGYAKLMWTLWLVACCIALIFTSNYYALQPSSVEANYLMLFSFATFLTLIFNRFGFTQHDSLDGQNLRKLLMRWSIMLDRQEIRFGQLIHDVRNPINTVLGLSHLMTIDPEGSQKRDMLLRLNRGVDQLINWLDDADLMRLFVISPKSKRCTFLVDFLNQHLEPFNRKSNDLDIAICLNNVGPDIHLPEIEVLQKFGDIIALNLNFLMREVPAFPLIIDIHVEEQASDNFMRSLKVVLTSEGSCELGFARLLKSLKNVKLITRISEELDILAQQNTGTWTYKNSGKYYKLSSTYTLPVSALQVSVDRFAAAAKVEELII